MKMDFIIVITVTLKCLFLISLTMIFTGFFSHLLRKKGKEIGHNYSKGEAILFNLGGLIGAGVVGLLTILGIFDYKILRFFFLGGERSFFRLVGPIAVIIGLTLAILFYRKLEDK